ncbi:MAG: hypothetical protein ACOC4G_09055 [Bacillota bacterium]
MAGDENEKDDLNEEGMDINLDEKEIKKEEEKSFADDNQDVNGIEFILFLILILLLAGNQNNFDEHFNIFENELNKITQLLNTFSATEEGLKNILSN